MDDIVTRLRNWHTEHDSRFPRPIDLEAADEIERLRKLTSELAQILMPLSLLMTSEEQQKAIKVVRGE